MVNFALVYVPEEVYILNACFLLSSVTAKECLLNVGLLDGIEFLSCPIVFVANVFFNAISGMVRQKIVWKMVV